MTLRISLAPGLALLLTLTATGQTGWIQMSIDPPSPVKVVKGRPYSYRMVSETKQIALDGTVIIHPATTNIFQDAAGRTRTERPIVASFPARPGDLAVVEIYDVVAGYRYVLDVPNKIAHRSAIPKHPKPPARAITVPPSNIASAQTNAGQFNTGSRGHITQSSVAGMSMSGGSCDTCSSSDPGPGPIGNGTGPWPGFPNADSRSEPSGKSLGTRVIEGLKCEGRLTNGTETWTSKELGIVVLARIRDQRGEERQYIQNFSRGEPNLALFQPPPDYKLLDQSGPFTITIPIR